MVNRRLLWRRLQVYPEMGLKTIRMLRSLFDFNKSVLVINGTESREILNRRGLLQGSSLSPILFNHFINDLILKLDEEGKLCTLGVATNCLFFADDAALHARTAQDLQLLLDICDCWAKRNGIRFFLI